MNPGMKLTKLPSIVCERRRVSNLTLEQLAKLTGLGIHHLSDIETGKIIPSLETLEKMNFIYQ